MVKEGCKSGLKHKCQFKQKREREIKGKRKRVKVKIVLSSELIKILSLVKNIESVGFYLLDHPVLI